MQTSFTGIVPESELFFKSRTTVMHQENCVNKEQQPIKKMQVQDEIDGSKEQDKIATACIVSAKKECLPRPLSPPSSGGIVPVRLLFPKERVPENHQEGIDSKVQAQMSRARKNMRFNER